VTLATYSWICLVLYVGLMIVCGIIGKRRVKTADDYATARGGYGPIFLALAFSSTAASGATFLGMPALAYHYGLSNLWFMFLYPIGLYGGVLLCQHAVAQAGNDFGARSIPEYLGEKYQSDAIRVVTSVYSLVLLFYLAGQLVSGLVMFETMLGLSLPMALAITTAVLAGYVVMGGAHADVFTDGIQGFLMVLLAIAVLIMFLLGFGVDGNLNDVLERIETLDPNTVKAFNPVSPITATPWHAAAICISFIPLGLLPHVGNKLWALRDESQRTRFVAASFVFGLILPCMAFGGILGRAVLGDDLIGGAANDVVPRLFIELMPVWLAALLGVGILAAIMSTADGVVVTMGQIFANDLYRLTYAPRYQPARTADEVDATALRIGRFATFFVLLVAAVAAWLGQGLNITLFSAIGFGGMSAAFAGPLILGILWDGVTKWGAFAGFFAGAVFFIGVISGGVTAIGSPSSVLYTLTAWLEAESGNAFSIAALGGIMGCVVTYSVSRVTPGYSDTHRQRFVVR
jgi:SSS family transporter